MTGAAKTGKQATAIQVRWSFCAKPSSEVAKVIADYRVYARKVPLKDGDYTMDHTALIYLMDRDGKFVSPFRLDRKPRIPPPIYVAALRSGMLRLAGREADDLVPEPHRQPPAGDDVELLDLAVEVPGPLLEVRVSGHADQGDRELVACQRVGQTAELSGDVGSCIRI